MHHCTRRLRVSSHDEPAPSFRSTAAGPRRRSGRLLAAVVAAAAVVAGACGDTGQAAPRGSRAAEDSKPLVISAIPDQDPERLQRLYGTLAAYLSERLGVAVEYRPVTDYTASVSLFATGELDLVWFGGLTGVQARLQVDGARAIVQRDVDQAFHSVFIANVASGIQPVDGIGGLAALKGRRFTFGSESSTSGRLMPQYYLARAGVSLSDFAGKPGFSGSHDRTIALVEAGTFEVGAVNEHVWKASTDGDRVDTSRVRAIFRTPAYHDYHWLIGPDAAERYGGDFVARVTEAFLDLDRGDPGERKILELFGATSFIPTDNGNYGEIEQIGRQTGLVH